MISANCAVGHSLKKGRVHMLFICQRGLQGFQVVKRSPYILLPFEQLKNSIQRGGLKKCFPKFDWLLLPLDNKVIVSVTITDFVFDFGNNRFIKKLKSPFCSILFCKTLCTNAMLKSLIVSITYKEMQAWKIQTNNIQTDVLSCFAKDFRHRWR